MGLKERILDKILSGRFIILIAFGMTICGLSLLTLHSITTILNFAMEKDVAFAKEIFPILKDILLFLLGHLTGSFSKIFDSYAHRPDRSKPEIINGDKKGEGNV